MTEGWCYDTMSVSALCKGHYCQQGLWEMTLHVLLLISALAACLTEPGCCTELDGSESPQTETLTTTISTYTTHTPPVTSGTWSTYTATISAVTSRTWNSTVTVLVQESEVSGGAETLGQVTLEQNSTVMQSPNVTATDVKLNSAKKRFVNNSSFETQDVQEHNNNTQDVTITKTMDMWTVLIISAACLGLALLLAAAAAGILIACRRRKSKTDLEKDDPYLDDELGEKVPMPMFEDDMPSVMELEMEDFEKWIIQREGDINVESKQRHPS